MIISFHKGVGQIAASNQSLCLWMTIVIISFVTMHTAYTICIDLSLTINNYHNNNNIHIGL